MSNIKYIIYIACVFSIQCLSANETSNDSFEHKLSISEDTCDVSTYSTLISSPNVEQWHKNYSLSSIMRECNCSKRLHELVMANINAGGEVTNTDAFNSLQEDAPFFCGYNHTALGALARTEPDTQDDEVYQDIEQTVKILLDHGAQKDTALLDAFDHQNIPVAQALIKFGANPHKFIEVGCNPVRSNYVSAIKVARRVLLHYERTEQEWKQSAEEAHHTGATDPNGSSIAEAHLQYARENKEKAYKVRKFILLFFDPDHIYEILDKSSEPY